MASSDSRRDSPLGHHLGFEPSVVDDEHAVQRLVIQPHHTNPTGAIHGGVIIALADNLATAMAGRANAGGAAEGKFMVGVDLHAVMLRNQQGGTITAESRVVRRGRRVTVIRTIVTGDDGKALAEVTTTHIPA
jgi:uncharacterized protein (TIGR00369 family)